MHKRVWQGLVASWVVTTGCNNSPSPAATTNLLTDTSPSSPDPSNDDEDDDDDSGTPGAETQPCVDGECLGALVCLSNVCVDADGTSTSLPTTGGLDPDTSNSDPSNSDPSNSDPSNSDPSTDPSDPSNSDPSNSDPSTDPGDPSTDPSDPSNSDPSNSDPSNSDPSTSDTGDECVQLQVDAEPAAVVLLLDKSGSMKAADYFDGVSDVSPWLSLRKTVLAAISPYQATTKFGMGLFPSLAAKSTYTAEACVTSAAIEVPIAYDTKAAIDAAAPTGANMLIGGGPMTRSIQAGVAALLDLPETTPKSIVIFSDGPGNCWQSAPNTMSLFEVYDPDLEPAVAAAYQDHWITTYVVGIQIYDELSNAAQDGQPNNINGYEKFNALAVKGGRPRSGVDKFYPMDDDPTLAAHLKTILDDAQGCHLVLDGPGIEPTNTSVTVGGTTYEFDAGIDCRTETGWQYIDGSSTSIRMCGAACDKLRAAGTATVNQDC